MTLNIKVTMEIIPLTVFGIESSVMGFIYNKVIGNQLLEKSWIPV